MNREAILRRLDDTPLDPLIDRIRASLKREDTRLVSDQANRVRVSEARRLWTLRIDMTDITGQTLHGATSLVSRLESLTPQRKLEQFAFVNSSVAGNLFFEGNAPHGYVGGVLIDSEPKRQ